MSRTVYSYQSVRKEDGSQGFSAKELEEGAISICKALAGKYNDVDGSLKPVRGDMTKVKYSKMLTPAARRLLQNIEHSTREVEGTQEVRRLMRFEINAGRIV